MSGRRELALPEGWKPARNVRVSVLPHTDEPVPPAGVWRIVDRSAGTPGPHWWAQPVDEAAQRWASRHASRIISGCLEVKGLRCVPAGTRIPDGFATGSGRR